MNDTTRRAFSARSVAGVAVALIAVGVVSVLRSFAEWRIGVPPVDDVGMFAWRDAHKGWITVADERLAIGAAVLVVASVGLVAVASRCSWPLIMRAGCALFALAGAVGVTLSAVHGRLVYPIFGSSIEDAASVRRHSHRQTHEGILVLEHPHVPVLHHHHPRG